MKGEWEGTQVNVCSNLKWFGLNRASSRSGQQVGGLLLEL